MANGSKTGALVSNFGVSLKWETLPNVIGNYSDVKVDLYLNYYNLQVGQRPASITIAGESFDFTIPALNDYSSGLKNRWAASKTVQIPHNSDGDHDDITVSATYKYDISITSTGEKVDTRSVTATAAFDNIDRKPPVVSLSYSKITSVGFYLSATVSTEYDVLQCSLDGGKSWADFSTPKTITGLSPNTTYQVQVRARRKYNQVYGYSNITQIKTLGGSILNSVSTLVIDEENPVITTNWTVYDASYRHILTIKKGDGAIISFNNLSCSAGTNNKVITLTAAQRSIILDYMRNTAQLTADFQLRTYTDSTGAVQVGSGSVVSGKIQLRSSVSAPDFSGFSFMDTNPDTIALTENAELFIQNHSALKVIADNAVAKNGASIVSYKAAIGTKVITSASTAINFGKISAAGNITVTVTATDSRGFSKSAAKIIKVYDYEDISITSWKIRRTNEVEPTAQLSFSGSISSVVIDEIEKNSLESAQYRYGKIGEQFTEWQILQTENAVPSFDFTTLELADENGVVDFNPENVYMVQIRVADKLSSDAVDLILQKGMSLVALRYKMVGINNNNPQSALDVVGDIRMNGFNVMGFVSSLTEENLNDVVAGGIYTQEQDANATNEKNYPVAKAGILEVIEMFSGQLLQRYTLADGSGIFIRCCFNKQWSAWRSLILE